MQHNLTGHGPERDIEMTKTNTLEASLKQQLKEEVGDQVLTDIETRMLQQKFGIVNPEFTKLEGSILGIKTSKRAQPYKPERRFRALMVS